MREEAVADGIVLYQVDDKVGIITLNRPEKLNAISRELQLALTEAVRKRRRGRRHRRRYGS